MADRGSCRRRQLGGFAQRERVRRERREKEEKRKEAVAAATAIVSEIIVDAVGNSSMYASDAVESDSRNMEKNTEISRQGGLHTKESTPLSSLVIDVDAIPDEVPGHREDVPDIRQNHRHGLKRKTKENARMEIKKQLVIFTSSSSESSPPPPISPLQERPVDGTPSISAYRPGPYIRRTKTNNRIRRSVKAPLGTVLPRKQPLKIVQKGIEHTYSVDSYHSSRGTSSGSELSSQQTVKFKGKVYPSCTRGYLNRNLSKGKFVRGKLVVDWNNNRTPMLSIAPDQTPALSMAELPSKNITPVISPRKSMPSSSEHILAVISQLKSTQALMKKSQDEHKLAMQHLDESQRQQKLALRHSATARRYLESSLRTILDVEKKELASSHATGPITDGSLPITTHAHASGLVAGNTGHEGTGKGEDLASRRHKLGDPRKD